MRPGGDSCLGWEGVVSLQLGCPVTWSRGVQWDPDQCYSLGSISPAWPGCACLNRIFKFNNKEQRKRKVKKTMRSAYHKCTSSRWKCGAGFCASGFFAANFQILNIFNKTNMSRRR